MMRFAFSKDTSDGSVVDGMQESKSGSRMRQWGYGNGSGKDHDSNSQCGNEDGVDLRGVQEVGITGLDKGLDFRG